MTDMPLVSVCLPTRNGIGRIEGAVASVLAQDHPRLELVISDNASTDGTEEYGRALAAADPRVTYLRRPRNVGLLGNFVGAARASAGEFCRWISDDDRLEPHAVSRALAEFTADPRLVLVTSATLYTGADGAPATLPYTGSGLGDDDPLVRFAELLRLLNQSHLMMDPLYGLFRRATATGLDRRNMLREDEVFAARLALAGPWAHVPDVLGHRSWRAEPPGRVAARLGVPRWTA
ncbi:glycosyltransferase family 2 protein, partial [Actinocorallia lasiicapitis]